MKKVSLLLIGIPLLLTSLIACEKQKKSLTYGTYLTQTIFSLEELSSAELINKANTKETFLLAVYQGEYSETCNCWLTFETVIANYMNNYHEQVYVYNAQVQDETVADLKIAKVNESTPYLYLFDGKEKITSFNYSNEKDKSIFSDLKGEAMYTMVHKKVNGPKMFYVDDNYIKNSVLSKEEALLIFIRKSCHDCSYVMPNVLIPYIKEKNIKKDIYVFDLDPIYALSNSETATDEEKEQYQKIKDYYNLSDKNGNPLGYGKGVVPTMQYYQNGLLKDASVYFNDVIAKDEQDNYYIKDSFYSEERLTSLHYLDDVKSTTVLKGMTISEKDQVVETETGYIFMAQSTAVKYHDPLFKAFLNYYCK